jgi:protein-S-isoprenylcysteine O-methyltransferase Ste14
MLIKCIITIPFLILYLIGFIDFAFVNINNYIRIFLGLPIIFLGFLLFIWAHYHLGKNWNAIVHKVSKPSTLITSGPYKYIRHPIYSASFITIIGFGILSANYIIFLITFCLFLILYAIRIPKEEKALIKHFKKEYIIYMKNTGRLFPKI